MEGDTARATTCDDDNAATFTDFDGPDTPESAGFAENRLVEVNLLRGAAAGQWLIQSERRIGTC